MFIDLMCRKVQRRFCSLVSLKSFTNFQSTNIYTILLGRFALNWSFLPCFLFHTFFCNFCAFLCNFCPIQNSKIVLRLSLQLPITEAPLTRLTSTSSRRCATRAWPPCASSHRPTCSAPTRTQTPRPGTPPTPATASRTRAANEGSRRFHNHGDGSF